MTPHTKANGEWLLAKGKKTALRGGFFIFLLRISKKSSTFVPKLH
jgi:hypothetical protein